MLISTGNQKQSILDETFYIFLAESYKCLQNVFILISQCHGSHSPARPGAPVLDATLLEAGMASG